MCVDGVVYFRVFCPISSVTNVADANAATRLLAQTTLRNVLGTKNLAELLSDREGLSHGMQVGPRVFSPRSGCEGLRRSPSGSHISLSLPFPPTHVEQQLP